MDIVELTANLSGLRGRTAVIASEADYLQQWLQGLGNPDGRYSNAVVGGALADRLAWVFIAGYQQAIRQCFDLRASGWLAYCASEDRTGELPGVSVSEDKGGRTLTGNKTWVAAVENLDAMVVTVQAKPTQHYLVRADAQGVRLSVRTAPGFLPDLSQGFAELTQVQVADELDRVPGPPFNVLEAVAIYGAFCGFVGTRLPEIELDRLMPIIAQAADLWGRRLDQPVIAGLKDLDSRIQSLAAEVDGSAESKIPGWMTDRRLISMYSRGIQALED